jgi:chemotaxis protein methyltransferase CheR
MFTTAETNFSEKQFRRLCDLVYQHCGITLHDGKQELVRARVARQLRNRPNVSAASYLDEVMANPGGEEFAGLIDALSTNLTSFFREPAHFTFMTERLVPEIIQAKRKQRNNRIRAWSAACSTGEEPYSIAITLAEALAGTGSWDAKLLATDISRNVLKTAVRGVYDEGRIRGVDPALRGKYFAPVERSAARRSVETSSQSFAVIREIRSQVIFNYLNLIETWPFTGPFDFIFCRNVMIYFDKQTQEKLVNRFWGCLEKGGVLFTGHSESLTGISHRFKYVQPTIYRKE